MKYQEGEIREENEGGGGGWGGNCISQKGKKDTAASLRTSFKVFF